MSLPGWLAPLPDAEAMRATDAWAVDQERIASLELMERAGHALADVVAAAAPEGRLAVVCGQGNNGGDGLVAARLLRERGREVSVLFPGPPQELGGDAAANLRALPGPAPEPLHPERLDDAAAVVDALLGTGATGAPRGPARDAVQAICAAGDRGAVVVAADVPSGVDASSGEAPGPVVRASVTATFHRAKPGLWIHPGKEHAGRVVVIDIGIPDGAPTRPWAGLIGPGVLDDVPRREAASTKFSSGHVVVVGGSRGLTGAPGLAAEAAQRAGAGYVTVALAATLEPVLESRLVEAMTVPLPDEDGALGPAAVAVALEAARRAGAVVLGPGLGRAPGTLEAARTLARGLPAALVVDADGLNAHAGRLGELSARTAPTLLTPHAGELARLLEVSGEEVAARRLHHARAASRAAAAIVVLKGDDTIVADPSGQVAISAGDAPALATAGTGDVLSGVLGALLARGMEPFHAACAGVWLHAAAGRLAARPHGPDGVIARDVVAALPAARAGAG